MMNMKQNRTLFIALASLAGTSALAADSSIRCAGTGSSKSYLAAKAAVEKGFLNLAFFSLDRVVRASTAPLDSAEFIAALGCLDQVQESNALVDLPNYDSELATVANRTKSSEASATIAHFAFRSILQRVAAGTNSGKSLDALLPFVKNSPFYEAAAVGLVASSRGDYSSAKIALRKAVALSGDAKTAMKAELRLALARSLYATGEDAAAIAEYESLYKIGAPMQDALIESAWAQLRSRNYVKSIGLSFELSTGKLSQFFAPEAAAIRAIGFVENCRFPESRNAISRFSSEYAPIGEWLKATARSEHSLYETALARSEGAIGAESVPEKVWSVWSSSDLFVSLQSSIRNGFAEERAAGEWITAEFSNPADAKTRATLMSDMKKMAQLRTRAANRIESQLAKLDRVMAERIARESERMRFVRIEASQGAGRDLVYRNANPGLSDIEKKVAKADRQAKSYRGKLAWGTVKAEDPKAEMWIDEIGNFEAATLDRCKAKAEYKKLQAAR